MSGINGELIDAGTIGADKLKDAAGLKRAQHRVNTLDPIPIYPHEWRVHDNYKTALGTAGTDDLGVGGSAHGTDSPHVTSGNMASLGATTRYARVLKQIPPNYAEGNTIQLRFSAGMTKIADNTATLDVEVYQTDREAGVDAAGDLCQTNAQDINDTNFADQDFTLDEGELDAGDWIDIRIAIAVNDAASGGTVEAQIGEAELLVDTQG